MNIIPIEQIKSVNWEDYKEDYDQQLHKLGKGFDSFYIVNPDVDQRYIRLIDPKVTAPECIVWMLDDVWAIKRFQQDWTPENGYAFNTLEWSDFIPPHKWTTNPDIDPLVVFKDDPYKKYIIPEWDLIYKHVWYLDSKYSSSNDKIWLYVLETEYSTGQEKDMGFLAPDVTVSYNPEIPNIECELPVIPYYELRYQHVWDLDLKHGGWEGQWAVKITPNLSFSKIIGIQYHGTISPKEIIEYNADIGTRPVIDYVIPYYDFDYKHVWYLDPKYFGGEKVWIASLAVSPNATEVKDMGIISYSEENLNIEFNPALPDLNFDTSVVQSLPLFDLRYAHVWYLDPAHSDGEKIWAVRVTAAVVIEGEKDMGYIVPIINDIKPEFNPALPDFKFDNAKLSIYDLKYERIWYLDPAYSDGEKIWAVKMTPVGELEGTKDMGYVKPDISKELDVVFISYNETNAEENWNRVKQKCPQAKRIKGVKGIFEAHKSAARIVNTDMFYVVDGDAYLVDDWKFDADPSIFDRDCVFVYKSTNPVNDLEYGYGGVKIFPKKLLLEATSWGTDMTTSIASKLKVIDKISNITKFNTDEFSAWRSAFRECTKLTANLNKDDDSLERLEAWTSKGIDRPFGPAALAGAKLGIAYARSDKDIEYINDRDWLYEKFIKWKENKLEENKNVLCPIPWTHLNFEPNGLVVPCCLTSTYNYFAGDLNKQSIDEIWNSDNMKTLRKEMINGIEPEICSKCFNRERVTGESGRTYHVRDYPEVIKQIPDITLPDGTCTTMELKYWDFRFSNLCNFKCRSCGPRYSSAWVPDAKKIGLISEQDKVWYIDQVDNKTNFDFLKDQVAHVERIYFAGGEPLLMDEHWQILEMLVENNRFDVKLSYNTNCSVLTYGKKNVIDYWKKWNFGKLEVWPSLDEIGPRAELIRAGTVWPKVEDNLKELITLDNAIIRPGITIGAMNVFRLPEIIMYLNELGVLKEKHHYMNFFINLLEDPKHYHVHILPDEFKEEIYTRLENFIVEYNSKFKTKIDPLLKHIMHELKKPHSPESAKRFLKISQQVDSVRDENIFEVIPELKIIDDMYPGIYRNEK